jgi:hypothetical protein
LCYRLACVPAMAKRLEQAAMLAAAASSAEQHRGGLLCRGDEQVRALPATV